MPTDRDLVSAHDEWRKLLGDDHVLDGSRAAQRYGVDTSTFRRAIGGAHLVRDRARVPDVVRVARERRVPLYPISRGNDWGYGT